MMDSGSSEGESSNDGENSKKRLNLDSSGFEQRASKKTRRMKHSSSSSDSDSGGEDSGKGEEIFVKSGNENEDEPSSDSEFDDGSIWEGRLGDRTIRNIRAIP